MEILTCRAFTVLELMVTVSVVAILVAVGVPSIERFSSQQAMRATTHTLQDDLLMARSSAIHRSVTVVACPALTGGHCSGNNDWSEGWMIFADSSNDGDRQSDEPIIRWNSNPAAIVITSSRGRDRFRFYPDGTTPGSNGSITLCGAGGPEQARKLIISNVGRIRRTSAPSISAGQCG